jgi:predicted permease
MKYALRSLLGSPGFSMAIILTFALGIGANTAVFGLLHSLVLEPLPFTGGDRTVQLWRYEEYEDGRRALFSPVAAMVAAWQEEELFEAMGAYAEEEFHLAAGEGVISVMGARVSHEFLSMVSATPLHGRLFDRADGTPGHAHVAILSEELWENRFGANPAVLGSTLSVDGDPHTIVGVVPRGVRGVLEGGVFGSQPKEILLPLTAEAAGGWSGAPDVVARLGPGMSLEMVQERMDVIQTRVATLIEGESDWHALAVPAREALAPGFRRGLWVVFGGLGVVLLIACANIATLLLVRGLARTEELQVRLALGAGRRRLAGQLITESVLLGGAGMVLAALSAGWFLDGAVWVAGGAMPEIRGARMDLDALAFGVAAGFVTVLVFSLIPILQLGRLKPAGAMARKRPRESRRSVGWTAHRFLVVGQVALATVLVVSAGLLSNSLGRLLSVDPGLSTEGLAAVGLDLPRTRYDVGMERIAFFDDVVEGLDGAPGVEEAGWARFVPPRVAGAPGRVEIEGSPPEEGAGNEGHAGNWVAPSYFGAVGSVFLDGRPFTEAEIADRAEVVILNRTGADQLWPEGGGGVGSRIRLNSDYGPSPWMSVVGIVPDYKAWWLGDRPDRMQIYLPVSNVPPRSGVILVRGVGELGDLASLVQTQVRRLDAALPIGEAYWVRDAFRQSIARQGFQASLLSSFGIIGMLLAVLGVYGVLSLSITRRTREIGVRLALGATRGDVIRKVLGQGLGAVTVGAVVGLGFSYFTSDVLSDLLWGIEALDPPTYVASTAGVILSGLAAAWFSTRRAAGIDPVEALKRE